MVKLIDLLNDIADKQIDKESIDNNIELALGEPDVLEKFEKDGLFYTRMTWKKAGGLIIKTIINEDSDEEKTLEEKLADALEEEDYVLAAKLRDLIEKENKQV
jgi:hypothetical protein